jgi:hypothetical protein
VKKKTPMLSDGSDSEAGQSTKDGVLVPRHNARRSRGCSSGPSAPAWVFPLSLFVREPKHPTSPPFWKVSGATHLTPKSGAARRHRISPATCPSALHLTAVPVSGPSSRLLPGCWCSNPVEAAARLDLHRLLALQAG